MSWFHTHCWNMVAKTYAPSATKQGLIITKSDFSPASLILFSGQTTIIWQCSICKKTRKEEMLGKEVAEETL